MAKLQGDWIQGAFGRQLTLEEGSKELAALTQTTVEAEACVKSRLLTRWKRTQVDGDPGSLM